MKEDLKTIIYMGLGAMSLTSSKAKELKEELLEEGKKIYLEGKVANESLKHHIEEKMKENVTVVVEKQDFTKEDLIEAVQALSQEEKEELLDVLKDNRKEDE